MAAPDPSTWTQLSEINPELKAALDAMPTPMPSLGDAPDVPTCRQGIETMLGQMMAAGLVKPPDMTGIKQEDIQIPVRDGSSIRAILVKPESGPPGPLAVLYHGGGWCIGMPEMELTMQVVLAKNHGATSISVDYRMAPEKVFPVPVEDCIDAMNWAAANASKLGADPSKGFIVGGSSAGGNISAVLALEARDKKLSPPLTGAWLNIPATCSPEVVPEKWKPYYKSFEQNRNAVGLDVKAVDFFKKWYKPDPKSEYFNPQIWPTGHKNLPPTYFQVCGMDPLRDEGLIYESTLRENGVTTKIDVYPGVPHAFEAFFPQLSVSAKALEDREKGFAWLFGKK